MRLPTAIRTWLRLLPDLHARAVHIENKIDLISARLRRLSAQPGGGDAAGPFADGEFLGHADQRYGHLTYSQHGEDLVFASLFERLGIARPRYLDIGAHHPIDCSNTALLHRRGSRGVNVDANPNLLAAFNRLRPDDINLNIGVAAEAGELTFYCIDETSGRNSFSREAAYAFVARNPQFRISAEIKVPVTTLERLVAEQCGGRYPELLSLDAEGLDYEILESASFAESRPVVICVEVDSAAGQSAPAIVELLRRKGFEPYIMMGANAIFIDGPAAARLRF